MNKTRKILTLSALWIFLLIVAIVGRDQQFFGSYYVYPPMQIYWSFKGNGHFTPFGSALGILLVLYAALFAVLGSKSKPVQPPEPQAKPQPTTGDPELNDVDSSAIDEALRGIATKDSLWKAQSYHDDDEGWQDLARILRPDRLETLYIARQDIGWDPVRAVRVEEGRETIEEEPSTDAATRIACSMVDIAIVGAGTAGLKAALEAGIDGFNTTFIDADIRVGGQSKFSSVLEPDGVESGKQFAGNYLANAVAWGAKPYLGVRVTRLAYDAQTGTKTLSLSDGQKIQALAVIIATGKSFRKMQFPGSDSKSVSYANEEGLSEQGEDKFAVVVGGSDFAGNAALGAAETAKHVYLLSPIKRSADDSWAGRMAGTTERRVRVHEKITVVEGDEIGSLRLDKDGNAVSLLTKGGKEIPCNALGIFVGSAPNTEWLPSEIERINGRVAVDAGLETSIPGVFAAGDVRDGSLSIITTALADASSAETHAVQHIGALMARKKKPYFQEWIKRTRDNSDWYAGSGRVEAVMTPCPRCLEYSQISDAKAR